MFGCSPSAEEKPIAEDFKNAEFNLVSLDSLPTPDQTFIESKRTLKLGKPEIVSYKNNKVDFKYLKNKISLPQILIPGENGIIEPKSNPLIINKRNIGRPVVIQATEPKSKDFNPYNLLNYGLSTGLIDNKVHNTFQDSKGNLWFGTYKGVTQFNGSTNKHYTINQGFLDDFFVKMKEDAKGNLWFLFDKEIEVFDGKSLVNFRFQPEDKFLDLFTDIIIDRKGNIWVSSRERGVFKIDKNLQTYTHYGEKEGLSDKVLCMVEDQNGSIWLGTENEGLFKWDGKIFCNYTKGLFDKTVFSISLSRKNELWIGTWTGISKISGDFIEHFVGLSPSWTSSVFMDSNENVWFSTLSNGAFYLNQNKIYNIHAKNGLPSNEAYDVMQDQAGYIWISTVNGVAKCNTMFRAITEEDGLTSSVVRSLAVDKKQNLWIGSELGGISYFDLQKETFSKFYMKDGLPGSNIVSLLVDADQETWVGCYIGYLSKISADWKTITHYPLSGSFLVSIFQDHLGDIWYSSREKGGVFRLNKKSNQLTHYTTKQGLVDDQVIKISQDADLNYIFATFKGVSFLSKDKGVFTNYPMSPNQKFDIVESSFQDHTGAYWFGILTDNGLIRLDRKTNKIFTFLEESGLPDNTVMGIIQDKNKNLWVNTLSGLARISRYNLEHFNDVIMKSQNVIINGFTKENGYLDNGDGRHYIAIDKNGFLWVPNAKSVARVDLSANVRETKNMKVEIVNVTLFNESLEWKRDSTYTLSNGLRIEKLAFSDFEPWTGLPLGLKLSHNNNYLGFQFAAINTSNPIAVKYEYILEGLDKKWSTPTYFNEVSYAKIPPGKYTFKVRGINSNGVSREEASFNFEISPPFWQTWYAYLAYILLFGISLYFYIRFRVWQRLKKIKEREALRTKISSDLHDDVGSILTGLSMQSQMMSLKADEKAKKQLLELSDMSFEAMDRMRDTVWAIDPSRDRFENLVDRMRSFAEKNLPNKNIKHNFVIEIDKPKEFINPDKRQAVFLIFKEALTNILKHTNATHVDIKVIKDKRGFFLYIKDNGTNKPVENKEGQGLGNMRLRAEKINANLKLEYIKGFAVTLSFMLED
ncbi:hypothetical protein EGI22_14195 [Lacihabitans sp. LS3-19]|nr:hypothetical protein [Lacihabitans sp. LS3-19]